MGTKRPKSTLLKFKYPKTSLHLLSTRYGPTLTSNVCQPHKYSEIRNCNLAQNNSCITSASRQPIKQKREDITMWCKHTTFSSSYLPV